MCAMATRAGVELHERHFVRRLQWIFGVYRSAMISAYVAAHAHASPTRPFEGELARCLESALRTVVAVRKRHAARVQ